MFSGRLSVAKGNSTGLDMLHSAASSIASNTSTNTPRAGITFWAYLYAAARMLQSNPGGISQDADGEGGGGGGGERPQFLTPVPSTQPDVWPASGFIRHTLSDLEWKCVVRYSQHSKLELLLVHGACQMLKMKRDSVAGGTMLHGSVRPGPQSNAPCNAMQRKIPLVGIVPREYQLGRVRFRDQCSTSHCIAGLPNSVRNRPLYFGGGKPRKTSACTSARSGPFKRQ